LRLRFTITTFILLASLGCAGKNPLTIVRPNARTPLEERAYNLMLTSEKLLNTAEACDTNVNDNCEVADFMRPVLGLLETAHNEALAASLIYKDFLDAGEDPTMDSAQNLDNLLMSVNALITRVVSGGGGQ